MGIFKVLTPIEEGINYFFRRSEVIQGNIANADTPNYTPKDLLFERALTNSLSLKRTDPRHLDPYSGDGGKFKVVDVKNYSGYDGNKVNLDEELAKLAETNLMIRTLNEVLRKEIGKIKLSIQGR